MITFNKINSIIDYLELHSDHVVVNDFSHTIVHRDIIVPIGLKAVGNDALYLINQLTLVAELYYLKIISLHYADGVLFVLFDKDEYMIGKEDYEEAKNLIILPYKYNGQNNKNIRNILLGRLYAIHDDEKNMNKSDIIKRYIRSIYWKSDVLLNEAFNNLQEK